MLCAKLQCTAVQQIHRHSPPQTFASTLLRYVKIDLKDHELDALAQFMGHDICVHRKFYRLPNDVVQASQLAKIFILMEKGIDGKGGAGNAQGQDT